jgi:hypothetical protein
LIFKHAQSAVFKAIVDSGSATCIFHSDIGSSIGIKPKSGKEFPLLGIVAGISIPAFFHKVTILIAGERLETWAGFSPKISVAGILGRIGFFDNFLVTIDPSDSPPWLEVQRIHRV